MQIKPYIKIILLVTFSERIIKNNKHKKYIFTIIYRSFINVSYIS